MCNKHTPSQLEGKTQHHGLFRATLWGNAKVFDFSGLRNHGCKPKLVPGVLVNDHSRFAFDFYFFWRYPASTLECWKKDLADLV
jgi:hypothetical protein